MKALHGHVVGDAKVFSSDDKFVDVTLEIRVRMTKAEAKEYDVLVDARMLDASVTLNGSNDVER